MAVAEVPFDLVGVKLAAPSARPGTVAKADAIGRLCASTLPFATVVAPAGYGKTTLLAKWVEADPRPFAWVALDGRDDDAVVFLRYIAAAIHGVEPLPAEVFEALSGPGGSTWSNRVPRVGSALGALERPLVLVLDDLHAVANPSCLDVLAALFEYVPAGSQIAVASREDPALPLARWRAHGLVHEIGVPDLRLDEQEAKLLLEAAGVELDADALSELTERTEGWPAGLYLAALSLQAGAPSPASAAGFSGGDRFVSEYFRFELLSRLPPAEARVPQVHLGAGPHVWRALRRRARDDAVGTRRSSRSSTGTASWYPSTGEASGIATTTCSASCCARSSSAASRTSCPSSTVERWPGASPTTFTEAAVVYGHAAGETDAIAGLVDGLALTLHYDGRMETLEEWLGWFGDDDLRRYPALAVEAAWVRALTGRPADAERWLGLAEGATSTIPLSDGSATIEPWVATLRAGMMPDGVEQALADADLALHQLSPDSGWRPAALVLRGAAHALLGATDRATDDLTAAVKAGLAGGAAEVVILAQAQLALLAANQGAWGEAGQRARAAQALVEERGLGDYSTSALAYVATARVALHEARPEDARAALTRAHRLRPLLDHGLPWLTIQVGLELTRAHLALAEAGAARTILTETERVLELRPHMGSLIEDARELRDRVAATSGSGGAWAMSLTGAELRLLPYLATHLMFPGDREQAVHLAQHRQDRGGVDLPQARCLIAQ